MKLYPFAAESTARAAYQNFENTTTRFINTATDFKSVYSAGSPDGLEVRCYYCKSFFMGVYCIYRNGDLKEILMVFHIHFWELMALMAIY